MITLREITAKTHRQFTAMSVFPEQAHCVATNAESFSDALFHPGAWFRGIYDGEVPVGFVMLGDFIRSEEASARPEVPVLLWRFMIDRRYQKRGLGRAALEAVVNLVKASSRQTVMVSSYVPGPHGPAEFYFRFGFRPTGEKWDNEEVIELALR